MQIQIISQTERRAEVVMKVDGTSETLHLHRAGAAYTDKWGTRHDLQQPTVTPAFLAGWYGVRAVGAIRQGRNAYALIRSACRQACAALPATDEAAA